MSWPPRVTEVEPNHLRRATASPTDSGYLPWQSTYLQNVDLPAAWDVTTGRNDLVIAVVDTGVDLHHPERERACSFPTSSEAERSRV